MDDEMLTKLLRAFEETYAERGVYRVLAQRSPDWKQYFDTFMADPGYRGDVAETFSELRKRLDAHQQFEEILLNPKRGRPQ